MQALSVQRSSEVQDVGCLLSIGPVQSVLFCVLSLGAAVHRDLSCVENV